LAEGVPNIVIRARTDADLVDCVVFLRDVHELSGYPVNWPADPKAWLTPPGALGCWVITVDDQVAGHVALTADGEGVLVERLFVDPKRTGGGLGRQLLGHSRPRVHDAGRAIGPFWSHGSPASVDLPAVSELEVKRQAKLPEISCVPRIELDRFWPWGSAKSGRSCPTGKSLPIYGNEKSSPK